MASSLVEFGIGGVMSVILHPTGYAKVLIQIGHEPLQPVKCKQFVWFGKDRYCYPNVLQYCSHIYNTDGFLGMYKGLFARLIGGYIGNYVSTAVLKELKKDTKPPAEDDERVDQDWVKMLLVETGQETLAKISGVLASQPFHVLMVRQMAQFVGGEKLYDGFFGGLREIYQTDGIRGFFAGVVPRLIGEVIFIWMGKVIASLVNRYIVESRFVSALFPGYPEDLQAYKNLFDAQSYVSSICGFLTSMITYRFTLISNIMAVSGTELVIANSIDMKPYDSWMDCHSHLKSLGELKRGSGFFFRYTNPRWQPSGPAMTMPRLHQY